jgi:hypothetical protein
MKTYQLFRLYSIKVITAKWLPLLLHKWEVLGSNLGLETDYPEVYCSSSQSLQANAGTGP